MTALMPTDEQLGFFQELHLGIPAIDEEHRRLFSLLHQLVVDPVRETTSEHFSEIITRINSELANHFRSEETYLKSCGMPEAAVSAHIEAHTQILHQLTDIHLSMTLGLPPDYESTIRQVGDWIVKHVKAFDLQLRNYL